MDGFAVFSILVDQPVFIRRSCTPLSGDFNKWGVGGLFTEKQTDFTISLPCQVCCWHNSTGYPGFFLEKSGPRLLTIKRADSVSSLLPAKHPRISQSALTEWEQQERQQLFHRKNAAPWPEGWSSWVQHSLCRGAAAACTHLPTLPS